MQRDTKLSFPALAALHEAVSLILVICCSSFIRFARKKLQIFDICKFSGVATFCRVKSAFNSDEATLPVAAEEGFTGFLHGSKRKEMMIGDFELELPLNVEDLEDVTSEDLLKVDSEGRCVISDHGHFGE